MWQKNLIDLGVKTIKKVVKPMAPMIGRTIKRVGNGQARVIVSGFGGPNLDPITHNLLVQSRIMQNVRPVVKGFLGKPGKVYLKPMTAFPNRGQVRFFPNFRTPTMKRHVVYDVRTTRQAVPGFTIEGDIKPRLVTKGTNIPSLNNPIKPPEIATERVVVHGFGGNSANKIYKPVAKNNNTPRTVVKGFSLET